MRAIDRTTKQFVESVREALPDFMVTVARSTTSWGRSNYVRIRDAEQRACWSARISDHAVGMRRAMSGQHDIFISAGARPASWAVWLGELVKSVENHGTR